MSPQILWARSSTGSTGHFTPALAQATKAALVQIEVLEEVIQLREERETAPQVLITGGLPKMGPHEAQPIWSLRAPGT